MSLTDNEIMQALEHCYASGRVCAYCPCTSNIDCVQLEKYDLDLINRQKAEIERLNRCNWHISNDLREEINRNIRLQAEIEELLVELEGFNEIKITVNAFWSELQKITTFKKKSKPTLEELLEYMENLKAEAIKEFAERVKEKAFPDDSICTQMVVEVSDIDDLVKEMAGDAE